MRPALAGLHDYHEVDRIARELNLAWRDDGAFDVFMTHLFMLPVSLARAFSFTSVALFCDNLEYADVSTAPPLFERIRNTCLRSRTSRSH